MERKPARLLRAAQIAEHRQAFRQRLNPASAFTGTPLSRLGGLARASVSLLRLAPGQESFAYHAHLLEEEWLFVLQGRGVALVDGREEPLAAGDFLAFPAPSVPHLVRNPFEEELVYLSGGENREVDVLDYPSLGQRYVLLPGPEGTAFHALGPAEHPFGPAGEDDP